MAAATNDPWSTTQSPFASVIGTNYVPTAPELKVLKELLVRPEDEISRLDTEIDRVQTLLNSLLSKKSQITDYMEALQALISPVRQIPPETLADIFVHCLPTEPPYALRDLNASPLILTTICRHWRNVALRTPQLWDSLHVYLPTQMSSDAWSRRIAGTKLWLQRSGSRPLSISFHRNTSLSPYHQQSDMSIAQKNMELMVRCLMQFSDRFKDVSLSIPATSDSFVQLGPSTYPALISLRVQDGDELEDVNTKGLSSLLRRMPYLKKLEVKGFITMQRNYNHLPCNWGNLTNLAIGKTLPFSDVLAILAETTRVRSISFAVLVGGNDPSIFQTTVHLNDLVEMRLTVWPSHLMLDDVQSSSMFARSREVGTEIFAFINCFQHCCLRLLSFLSPWSRIIILKWPFTGLALQDLEELVLLGSIMPDVLSEGLAQTPNLITFELTSLLPKFTLLNSHLSGLTPAPENPAPLWPLLQSMNIGISPNCIEYSSDWGDSELDDDMKTLKLELKSIPSFTNAALTTFLKSRQQTTLRSCDVVYYTEPSFTEAELLAMRNLRSDGMRLRIRCIESGMDRGTYYHDLPDTGLVAENRFDRAGCFNAADIL